LDGHWLSCIVRLPWPSRKKFVVNITSAVVIWIKNSSLILD
jgi:hypothetical protein